MLRECRSVEEFERLNRISEGTYGVVYRAKEKATDRIVALKKVRVHSASNLRRATVSVTVPCRCCAGAVQTPHHTLMGVIPGYSAWSVKAAHCKASIQGVCSSREGWANMQCGASLQPDRDMPWFLVNFVLSQLPLPLNAQPLVPQTPVRMIVHNASLVSAVSATGEDG